MNKTIPTAIILSLAVAVALVTAIAYTQSQDIPTEYGASIFAKGGLVECPGGELFNDVQISSIHEGKQYVVIGNEPSYLTANGNQAELTATYNGTQSSSDVLFTKIIVNQLDPAEFSATGLVLESSSPMCNIFHSGEIVLAGNCFTNDLRAELYIDETIIPIYQWDYAEVSCDIVTNP